MKRPRIAQSILIFVIGMLIASCSRPEVDLARGRERWAAAGMTAYQFHLRRSCFCSPEYMAEVIIEVVHGAIQTVRYADTGEPIGADRFFAYETVEDLFDIIENAIENDVVGVYVTYDIVDGYPLSVEIDYYPDVADEEISFYVSDLRPLPNHAEI